MTVEDVSRHLKMSWHTIKEIDKRYLKQHFSKPRLKDVKYLAIDEFAYKKGHKYKTVVYDLEYGRALYVGDGRKTDALDKFWKRLKSSGAKVKAVATDMWEAYWGSVIRNLPEAVVVFDLFHIVKQYNKCLDDIRIGLYRQETDLNKRLLIKGTKWLLLKNEENLNQQITGTKQKNEVEQLAEALSINMPLATAYYLKDELKEIWRKPNIKEAAKALDSWITKGESTKLIPLQKFCNLLRAHRSGILNWHKHQISTGPLEGFNNKIKVLKRKAYGYRDEEYFELKILSLHISRYALLR
jgi:transposase